MLRRHSSARSAGQRETLGNVSAPCHGVGLLKKKKKEEKKLQCYFLIAGQTPCVRCRISPRAKSRAGRDTVGAGRCSRKLIFLTMNAAVMQPTAAPGTACVHLGQLWQEQTLAPLGAFLLKPWWVTLPQTPQHVASSYWCNWEWLCAQCWRLLQHSSPEHSSLGGVRGKVLCIIPDFSAALCDVPHPELPGEGEEVGKKEQGHISNHLAAGALRDMCQKTKNPAVPQAQQCSPSRCRPALGLCRVSAELQCSSGAQGKSWGCCVRIPLPIICLM